MSKQQPKLSQQVLLSILTEEIETLHKSTETIKKLLPQTDARIERLEEAYNRPLSVDVSLMKEEHGRIKESLSKGVKMPQWSIIALGLLLLLFVGSSLGFYHYYQKADEWEKTANHWYEKANP